LEESVGVDVKEGMVSCAVTEDNGSAKRLRKINVAYTGRIMNSVEMV